MNTYRITYRDTYGTLHGFDMLATSQDAATEQAATWKGSAPISIVSVTLTNEAAPQSLAAPVADAPLNTGRRLRIDPRTFTLCTTERALILDALSLHIDRLAKRGHLLASGPNSWQEKKRAQLEQVDRESERACELFALFDAVTIRHGT